MTDTYKLAQQIESLTNAFFRANADGKITIDELGESIDSLKRTVKELKTIIDTFEKPIKSMLDNGQDVVINNRQYQYKIVNSYVFDTDKAKATLESLEYSLEDFQKPQIKKTLDFIIKK